MGNVLIVGGTQDPEVQRVCKEVRVRGGKAIRLDTEAFPQDARLSLFDGEVRVERRKLPPIQSIYLRNLNCYALASKHSQELTTRPYGLMAQYGEKRALLTSLLLGFHDAGVPMINTFEANAQHSRKPYQLHLLREAGLPVPRFIATNDPRAARGFVRRVKQAIYKPLAGGATVRDVTTEDLSGERLAALSAAPVLFQELIHGVSVRAYVVGQRVAAAAEIHSPELDYRLEETEVLPTSLSAAETQAAVAAAKVCRMPFTGVDLIRRQNGFTVLECNPSPMFAVFEEKTGLNVAHPLAGLLLGSAKYLPA